jgi:hypothetical protein
VPRTRLRRCTQSSLTAQLLHLDLVLSMRKPGWPCWSACLDGPLRVSSCSSPSLAHAALQLRPLGLYPRTSTPVRLQYRAELAPSSPAFGIPHESCHANTTRGIHRSRTHITPDKSNIPIEKTQNARFIYRTPDTSRR